MVSIKLAFFAVAVALSSHDATASDSVHLHIKVHRSHVRQQPKPDKICLPGWSMVSVEGVQGAFCTKGEICLGSTNDKGNCPQPQDGLPFGSHCGKVKSGAFGCIPNSEKPPPPKPMTEKPTTEKPPTKPTNGKPTTGKPPTGKPPTGKCSPGWSPISVEGVEGTFCTEGDICLGYNSGKGNCPGPQDGLMFGSYCGKVRSGAFGCIAYVQPPHRRSNSPSPLPYSEKPPTKPTNDKPTNGKPTNDKPPTSKPPASKCSPGWSAVSVEGVEGTFCTRGEICLGYKSDKGNCPGPQDGLPKGSYCGKVASGAFGCKPSKN